MKRLMAMSAVLALGSTAFGELLANGNLNSPGVHESDTIDNWTLIEPDVDDLAVPVNSATGASFADRLGGGIGLWFRAFEGGLGGDNPLTVDAHLQQDVAGSAGNAYSLSAWYRYETNYSGLDGGPTSTILAMDFLGAGDALIGSVELDIDGVYDSFAFGWQQFSINGVAPAGTVEVRARASFLDGRLAPANPQSAFVDDFSMVPEPTSLGLLILPALALIRRR